jgi:cyclic pyranopterin phosphate synthase
VQLGVNKIRLTGGEPLVRKDAADILLRLAKLPVKLTLTTNGTRIHEFIDVLEQAGIRSLNISLDTLQAATFKHITRRDQFQKVYENIQLLIQRNFHVKVNVVVMKGLNDGEINDFIAWTKQEPVHVRFIEFMPFMGNQWTSNKVFAWQQILQLIEQQYSFLPLKNEEHDTAKSYIVPGHAGTFSVITTMSAPFCSSCNRMRLTADGKMKNCLFAEQEMDLLTALRKGEDVTALILQNIQAKAKELGGQFTSDFTQLDATSIHNRTMIGIGG